MRLKVIDLTADKARKFFLQQNSYCDFVPKYFWFEDLLLDLSNNFSHNSISKNERKNARNNEKINYTIYTHKNNKLSWRPLTLINPIMYVYLVHTITEQANWKKLQDRFTEFGKCKNIICSSVPIVPKKYKKEQILEWWYEIEQKSIQLSLTYRYVIHTDIADCYPSIYTHSIAWAVMGYKNAKKNRKTGLGNKIDTIIQDTHLGQTNGIPQGSILMDFIAEIVLGYIDRVLELKLRKNKITDYKILRYRDDYRIFTNNKDIGEKILKIMAEVLLKFNLKLNSSKTKLTDDIINSSIKEDKINLLEVFSNKYFCDDIGNLQKILILLRNHCVEYPAGGKICEYLEEISDKLLEQIKNNKKISPLSLRASRTTVRNTLLQKANCAKNCLFSKENYYTRFVMREKEKQGYKIFSDIKNNDDYYKVLVAIVVDIAYINPKTIPNCFRLISYLFGLCDINKIEELSMDILNKVSIDFNSDFFQIWLHRIVLKYTYIDISSKFSSTICHLPLSNDKLFVYSFLDNQNPLNNIIQNYDIFNQEKFDELDKEISKDEIPFNRYIMNTYDIWKIFKF